MELFVILLTAFIFLPITFPYVVLRLITYCLSLYLNSKHSILLSVQKCGFLSFKGISIWLPQKKNTINIQDGSRDNYLVITIDSLRFSSLYLDRTCTSLLSVCAGTVKICTNIDSKEGYPLTIGLVEFRMDKIRSDFIKYYKENFNIVAVDVNLLVNNFIYKIEKLVILKESTSNINSIKVDFDKFTFLDLSVPEQTRASISIPRDDKQQAAHIVKLELEYLPRSKNLILKFDGDCFLRWNIELHLSIVNVINYYKTIKELLKSKPKTTSQQDCDILSNTSSIQQTSNLPFILESTLNGRFDLDILISNEENATFEINAFELSASFPGIKKFKSNHINIYFDGNKIVSANQVSLAHLTKIEAATLFDRKQNSCGMQLKDEFNSLLLIEIAAAAILFPYDYDFGTAFNEKFMGIMKWVKLFYKPPKAKVSERASDENLKPIDFDINLKVNKFSFEIEDDPFEMKLKNNYMLLEDEYREQLQREQTLQEKINELKKTNVMLTSQLDELKKAMARKNSDIYVQRSKHAASCSDKEVPLFTVVIEEADLKFIADSSFHKHSDMRTKLASLDPCSTITNDLEFSTLWCRTVLSNFKKAEVSLRDFSMTMVGLQDLTIKGTLLGLEQTAIARARRTCQVYVGRNSPAQFVERSLTPMKFFHDLQLRCESASYTHGPCWEPVLQQVSLQFEKIVSASKDPSPSLSWWDKLRFIFHGTLKINISKLAIALHASNNPYNHEELIELSVNKAIIEHTTGNIRIKGDFDALLHTASKYDECKFVHIPSIDIICKLNWICLGNSNDHFTIMPCAPDKVPDYSSHQTHDSYRSFRSQNLDISLSIETQNNSPISSLNSENMPCVRFFGSTIRWLESQKFIFIGPSKLTRRGKLFSNTKPRKASFVRIINKVHVKIKLDKFQILYWSSVSKRHGIHIHGKEFLHESEHVQSILSNAVDNLIHRQQPSWKTLSMSSNLSNVEIWLYNLNFEDLDEFDEFDFQNNLRNRQYFISFRRVTYNKEAQSLDRNDQSSQESLNINNLNESQANNQTSNDLQSACHKMVIYDLKGAWTKENREVILGIYDTFIKNLQLKRNLSTEALKPIRSQQQQQQHQKAQSNVVPIIASSPPHRHQRHPSTASLILTNIISPVSSVSKNRAVSMLHKLIADSENNPTVYSEESLSGVANETHLYGVEACETDDVIYLNCLIELVNSQVALCGTETPGYVIVSAANTEIRQRIHVPVWKNRTLLSKTTWNGSLKSMQYYATVDNQTVVNQNPFSKTVFANESDIQWLDSDNIDDSQNIFDDYLEIIESGKKLAGGNIAGITIDDELNRPIQLQRIISRCNCLFYLAKHTEGVSDELQQFIPLLPDDDIMIEPWDKEVGVDSFTVSHQDLDINTNSQQYAIVLDIINNLLLQVEPHKKDAFEQQERMRFRYQLESDDDHREPISKMQDQVRQYVSYLKNLERERYRLYRTSIDDTLMSDIDQDYRLSLSSLSAQIQNIKEKLNSSSEQLAMMINCYKETQLGANRAQEQQTAAQHGTGAFFASVIKRNEICFKSARWRVNDSDGQLGLADIVLSNFMYSKVIKSDDSVEHTIELGHLNVSNLIPNQHYKDVLHPTELQANIPLDRQRALRVYCRELAPVGGIPVKEHLEVNVVPFTIEITLLFFQKMVRFFFPEKDAADKEKANVKKRQDSSLETQVSRFNLKRAVNDHSSSTSISMNGNSEIGGHTNPLMNLTHERIGIAPGRNLDDTISTMSTATMNSTATSINSNVNNHRRGDDIEKMRERASKNHTFVYVKIPGIPIKVSYKGKKQKNVLDLKNMSLTLPTYEYHNSTWTWLDLLMAVKNDSKHTVIKQALKQKMKIRPSALWSKGNSDNHSSNEANVKDKKDKHSIPVTDEEKARLLLGQYAKGWRIESDTQKSNADTASLDSETSR